MAAAPRAREGDTPHDLFSRGELSACVRATFDASDFKERAVRIRALLRLKQVQDAFLDLNACDPQTEDERAVVLALRIQAASALGCWSRVDSDREAARKLRLRDPDVIGELACAQAIAEFRRSRPREMRAALRRAVPGASPAIEARLLAMRAWLASMERQYAEHVRLLERATQILIGGHAMDVELLAGCVQALTHASRELFAAGSYEFVCAAFDAVPWTGDLAVQRFLATRGLAWAHALRGAHRSAALLMLQARDRAPSQRWLVACYADQAYLARMAGDEISSGALREHATELALSTAWGSDGEERVALLNLMELAADEDPRAAIDLLRAYDAIDVQMDSGLALRHDGRLAAMEEHARACVAVANGERGEAEQRFARAYDVFLGAQYAWRAAASAMRMHQVTGDRAWLSRASHAVRDFPESSVAREIRRHAHGSDDPRYAALTPTQRRVFLLICDGLSNEQIAKEMSISVNTAKNHAAAVRARFAVNSRAQLIARARASGLIA